MPTVHSLDAGTTKRLAVFLLLLGMLFSIDTIIGYSFVYKLWPIVILNLGIGFIGIFIKRNAREALYLVVGEYLVLFSFLAFYCNFTSWRILSHLWPLFVTFLGCSLITHFIVHRQRRLVLFLGLLLVALSLSLYLVFSVGGHYWWTIFILAGLSILISGLGS